MTAIVTNTLRLKNSAYLKQVFSDPSNSLYLFVSRPLTWVDENQPINPTDSRKFEQMVRDQMISLRKIAVTEVSQSIFRINWVSGKFYDMYRDDYDGVTLNGVDIDTGSPVARDGLINANFYVVTDEYNVYKCIYNNGGAASTTKPTGTSTAIFQTADGYKWKFMYSINSADALRFVSSSFIPVTSVTVNPGASSPFYNQYLVQSSAVDGKLEVSEIVSAGAGYAPNSTLPLTILGDGTGATGTATTNGAGQVVAVNISGGTGYNYARVSVVGASSAPAVINVIMAPKGGHGADPTKELNAVYLTTSATIGDDTSGDTLQNNQYRILGLLLNPKVFGSSAILTSQTASALRSVTISGGINGTFSDDENLLAAGTPTNRGTFVSYLYSSNTLKYIRNPDNVGDDFVVSQTITGQNSGAIGVVSSVNDPEVDTLSGEIVYVETRKPIFRSNNQKEDIRITIET